MKAAILGLPSSGKSTVFAAATNIRPPIHEAAQVRQGVVGVPDERLTFLAELYKPKKITKASIEFVDVPGFSLNDPKGQADLKKYLPTIRNCDMLVLVVRDFANPSVPAYRNRVDRDRDFAELRDELMLADLQIVANRVERLEKALSKPTKTHDQEKRELDLLKRCQTALEASNPISSVLESEDDAKSIASFAFLTEKPAIVVFNVDEGRINDQPPTDLQDVHSASVLCADIESQIAELDEADRVEFMNDLGIKRAAAATLIEACYDAMGLISFLTTGPDEVRAWPLHKGATAVDAAHSIHSDLARGFIRAETVAFSDLVEAGDMRNAKANGKVRQEGKNYIVKDGDIINIKFNV